MARYQVFDPVAKKNVTFVWDGDGEPNDADIDSILKESRSMVPATSSQPPMVNQSNEPPAWAAKYPNLYGLYGAGRELLRTGIETAGTTGGAAAGSLVPFPGTSFVGAGAGYAGSKRLADYLLGDNIDTSPEGIVKDVGVGALFQGAGKLIGKIPAVNRVLSPSIADVSVEKNLASPLTDKLSYSIMEKSMKVPPSVKEAIRERAINTALNENVPITKSGLGRVHGMLEDLNGQMDAAVASNPNAMIQTDSVLGPVRELQTWASKTVNGNKFSGQIQKVIDNFKNQYGPEITVADAQEIKRNTNAFLRKSYGQLKPVTEEAQKQIVRGLKDRIAQEIPEITGINARYSDLKILESALERAVNRTGNWDFLNLSAGIVGAMAGGATGKIATAAEATAIWRMLKSPVVQSNLALVVKKMGHGGKSNAMANAVADSIYNKLITPKESGQYQEFTQPNNQLQVQ